MTYGSLFSGAGVSIGGVMEYVCATCGNKFRSYNPKPQFCSLECKGKSQMATVNQSEIASVYLSGHTQEETAIIVGTSIKVVFNTLRRLKVKTRPAIKRNQRGAANSSWKGDKATYSALHIRVEAVRGKPSKCDRCGTTQSKRFEWANLTGNYSDTNDYERMCGSCHKRMDASRRRITGHDTSSHVPRKKGGVL